MDKVPWVGGQLRGANGKRYRLPTHFQNFQNPPFGHSQSNRCSFKAGRMSGPVQSDAAIANLVQECFTGGDFNLEAFKSRISSVKPIPLTRKLLDSGGLKSGTIVEYRGMVQDMFDPEIFCLKYHSPKQNREFSGLFQDFLPTDDFDPTKGHESLAEREIVYLVPVPGEARWARTSAMPSLDEDRSGFVESTAVGRERIGTRKREREDDEEMDISEENAGVVETAATAKRKKEALGGLKKSNLPLHENHPIPTETELPCMAKFYEPVIKYTAHRRYQLQDVVRIYGVLSLGFDDNRGDAADEMDFGIETRDCLPSSVAPRIHVIDFQVEEEMPIPAFVHSSPDHARNGVLGLLTQSLQGDALAAEMVLLWLVSGVNPASSSSAEDVPLVGKLSLGLTKMSARQADDLKTVISELVHRSQTVDVDTIAKGRFVPRKNMDLNRLEAGRLQVAHGTRVLLDETSLAPRTLEESALRNIQALNRLAEYQKVEYDFKFYNRDQNVDQPLLVLSPGSSKPVLISAVDCVVPVASSASQEVGEGVSMAMIPPQTMDSMRSFVETCRRRSKPLDLMEETIKAVESDFVSSRRQQQGEAVAGEGDKITEKDLHLWLNLARFTAATMGRDAVTVQDYARARAIDTERRRRLAALLVVKPSSTSQQVQEQ